MFWTAFILGLAGSLHCAGMCSPLAFSITSLSRNSFGSRIIYNSGRILTYGMLGAIVGLAGFILPLEKFQNGLSIGMGVILIVAGVAGASHFQVKSLSAVVQKSASYIKKQFGNHISRKTFVSYFILGSLNGLLPCGLTLIALTACIIVPSSLDGFYFMLMFGAGTLPVMLGFVSVFQFISRKFKLSINRVNMVMLIIAGGLLIGRVYFDYHGDHSIQAGTSNIEVCEPN